MVYDILNQHMGYPLRWSPTCESGPPYLGEHVHITNVLAIAEILKAAAGCSWPSAKTTVLAANGCCSCLGSTLAESVWDWEKKSLHPIELWSHYEVQTQSTKLTKHVPRTFANSQWKYLESGNQNTNGWMLIKLDITPVKPPFRQKLPTAQVSKSNSSEFVRGLRAWTVCECWSFSSAALPKLPGLNDKYDAHSAALPQLPGRSCHLAQQQLKMKF